MFIIEKTIKTRTGHKLCNLEDGHKCMNIHGEYYTINIALKFDDLQVLNEETCMAIDFGDMKKILNEVVFETFDHSLLVYKEDPIIEDLKKLPIKLVVLEKPPTAEYIAYLIYKSLVAHNSRLSDYLYYVEVIESENNKVRFYIG